MSIKSIIGLILFMLVFGSLHAQEPVIQETHPVVVANTPPATQVDVRIPEKEKLDKYRKDKRFSYAKKEVEEITHTATPDFWVSILKIIMTIVQFLVSTPFLIWLFVSLVVLLLVVLVIKVLKVDIKALMGKNNKEEIEIYTEDVHEMDFAALIAQAMNANNYRGAVRYLYLQNLKLLSDKSIIQWKVNKTNYSYGNEISQTSIKPLFLRCTYIFDYVWYGEFALDDATYQVIEKQMTELNTVISNEE